MSFPRSLFKRGQAAIKSLYLLVSLTLGTDADRRFAKAILLTLTGHLSAAERDWVEQIEARRRELLASTLPINQRDYGAGCTDEAETTRVASPDKTVGEFTRQVSKNKLASRLLFHLVRNFKPPTVLELGSAVGISGSYQAAALSLNQAGQLITLEGCSNVAKVTRETFATLNFTNVDLVVGKFEDKLDSVLLAHHPVDLCLVDGHHDEVATVEYFEAIRAYSTGSSLLVFDDINWSEGMKRAWKQIAQAPGIRRAFQLGGMGFVFLR